MKILVVDDDPVMLNLCTDLLGDAGYEVASANNVPAALERLGQEEYDLVITDIKMPKVSGLEIVKQLHTISPRTKAIIMTGFGDLETAGIAIKEGAYDYILKPFNNEAFRQAVRSALKRKQLEEENARLKELTGLFQVSEFISSHFTPQNLLQLILQSVINQLQATQGSIMLLDSKRKTLKIAAAVGLDEEIVKNSRVKVGEGIAGRVIQQGKPILITNIDHHPLFSKLSQGYPDKSFMSASLEVDEELISFPLINAKTVLGVINVRRKAGDTPFNEGDLELISILATQAATAIENSRLFSDLNSLYLGVMQFIVALTEARDVYLRGHTQRVTKWCLRLGRALGMGKGELTTLKYAATLHDIGKLAISEAILNKPAKLTPQEFEVIKTHPAVGANILKPLKFLNDTRRIVLHHHERLDGMGYPDGISGKQLSLPMNIIILVDSYDAMNSDRAYRKALPKQQIIEEIISAKGKQFHPEVVNAFLKLLKGGKEK